jgi:Cytochrome c554 and c-prime
VTKYLTLAVLVLLLTVGAWGLALSSLAASNQGKSEVVSETHAGLVAANPPESCQSCHSEIYDQWKDSFHAKATTSPFFRGVAKLFNYSVGPKYARECLNCHATDVKLTKDYQSRWQAILADESDTPGVTCTACHAIRDVEDIPDLLVPAKMSVVKTPFHNAERSPMFKKEVMCSGCHDYNNSHAVQGDWEQGVACCDTNRDFRKTRMAKKGVSCQTCHMAPGLDKDPKAWQKALSSRGSIKDALLRLVNLDRYAENREFRGHRFPGSHDAEVLKTAVKTSFEVQRKKNKVQIRVGLENLTGHSIPNGCPPRARIFLRIWLEDADGFEVDSQLEEYGFNFKDKDGFEPVMVPTAVARGFDNVLEAETTENVQAEFTLPAEGGPFTVKANLIYNYFVTPPPEAQNRIQQGIIRRIQAGTPAQKDYILNVEIPGRMAAMNQVLSTYPAVLMWRAEQRLAP